MTFIPLDGLSLTNQISEFVIASLLAMIYKIINQLWISYVLSNLALDNNIL